MVKCTGLSPMVVWLESNSSEQQGGNFSFMVSDSKVKGRWGLGVSSTQSPPQSPLPPSILFVICSLKSVSLKSLWNKDETLVLPRLSSASQALCAGNQPTCCNRNFYC